jgi:hypothetical protein
MAATSGYAVLGVQAAAERRSRLRAHLQCLADEFQERLDESSGKDEPEGTVIVKVKMSGTLCAELIESLRRAKSLI